jgi:hypothetical protein
LLRANEPESCLIFGGFIKAAGGGVIHIFELVGQRPVNLGDRASVVIVK